MSAYVEPIRKLLTAKIIRDNLDNLDRVNDCIDSSIIITIVIDKNIVFTDLSNKNEIKLLVK